tara:strand:- start:1544 stop:1957 length:414 start_codon:yes stop_codon:yes gene_type:complete
MISEDSKIIAVDFDGTIVDDMFPEIGKPKVFAFQTLKMLQKDGHRLILWTYRFGRKLDEAVNFCRENGIEFYAVNKSFPEEILNEREASRKINADIFIDDRNLQGFPGWGEVYQKIGNKEQETVNNVKPKKKGFFKF